MWAAIISAVAAVFKAAAAFIAKRRDELLVSLGASKQLNTELQGKLDQISQANKAKIEVEREIAEHPENIDENDGFRRD